MAAKKAKPSVKSASKAQPTSLRASRTSSGRSSTSAKSVSKASRASQESQPHKRDSVEVKKNVSLDKRVTGYEVKKAAAKDSKRHARGAAKTNADSQAVQVSGAKKKKLHTFDFKVFRKNKSQEFDEDGVCIGSSSSQKEDGPRAAVYKGEMGKSATRAARMQTTTSHTHSFDIGDKFSNLFASKKFRIFSAVAILLIVGIVSFYPSAQNYYKAMRENMRLEAEYAAVLEANEELTDQLEYYQSDAGIEQKAREQFGWVKADENAVIVYGANSGVSGDKDVVRTVLAGTVKAPETWWSVIFDPIFGVE